MPYVLVVVSGDGGLRRVGVRQHRQPAADRPGQALLAHPAVREAAVIGAAHPDLEQQVVAYVVADAVTEAQIIEFVAGRISAHIRPRQVHLVEQLPRNAMGKVQKKLLAGG